MMLCSCVEHIKGYFLVTQNYFFIIQGLGPPVVYLWSYPCHSFLHFFPMMLCSYPTPGSR